MSANENVFVISDRSDTRLRWHRAVRNSKEKTAAHRNSRSKEQIKLCFQHTKMRVFLLQKSIAFCASCVCESAWGRSFFPGLPVLTSALYWAHVSSVEFGMSSTWLHVLLHWLRKLLWDAWFPSAPSMSTVFFPSCPLDPLTPGLPHCPSHWAEESGPQLQLRHTPEMLPRRKWDCNL